MSEQLLQNRWSTGAPAPVEARKLVSRHPWSSSLLAWGAGVGCGLLLCNLLTASRRPATRRERAQRFGQQMIEALGHALPERLRA